MRHSRVWYLIADGGRARIVIRRDERETFVTLRKFESPDIHHRSHDIGSDRPGRSHESANVTRHAVEPREDIHRAVKRAFAQEMAEMVNEAATQNEFDRLVLVAPAPILGEIRKDLDAATALRVTDELQRDLTKVPDTDLNEHLDGLKFT